MFAKFNDMNKLILQEENKDIYYHGSVEEISGYLNKPINWITKDYNYAKTFALENGYVYECSANLGNLIDVGKTDARVFDMIPSNPLKFSREFTAIIRRLNISEEAIRKIIENVANEYGTNSYRLAIRPVVRSMSFKRILEGLGYNGIRAIEYDSINDKDVETFGLFDNVKVLDKVEDSYDEGYNRPTKTFDINGEDATWDRDAEDNIYWGSEAGKWQENYAKSYKIRMSPKDFLDLTTIEGADNLKVGDEVGGIELRDMNRAEFDKWTAQPIFLKAAFRDKSRPTYAQVVGHEGRHRMFALMSIGVKNVDVELACDVWDTEFEKYKPFELDEITLQGQFNKSVFVTVYNPIPLSWKNHKAIRPELKDENLNEFYDKIDDQGDSYNGYAVMNDCPIYMTDEAYKVKAMLERGDTPYRILYLESENCYLIQNAFGNKTHWDMARVACNKGYFTYLDYNDDAYMVFIPKGFQGKLRWHTRLGEDSYYNCRVYDFGVIFVRDPDAYNNSLFQALGEPERELYYDEDSEIVYCNKDDKTFKLDVYLDLGSDPEEAITCNTEDREVVQAPTECEVKIEDLDTSYDELMELDEDSIRQKVKDFLESKYGEVVTEFDIVENNDTTIFVDNIKWQENESLNESIEDNFPFTWEEVESCYPELISTTYESCGPAFILPDGRFLLSGKRFETHAENVENVMYKMYHQKNLGDSPLKMWGYDTHEMLEDFTKHFKLIRVNDGTTDAEDRAYFVIVKRVTPTQGQWNSLASFIDFIYIRWQGLSATIQAFVNDRHKLWMIRHTNTDSIIEDCKRALRYGYFTENLNEFELNENKVLRLPKEATSQMIDALKGYYKGLELRELPIDKLIKDNDLLNDDDLQSYHKGEWNHALAKDFHSDKDKINSMKMGGVPFVIQKKDGRLLISDGRHRTRAAYNDGYTGVEYPVYSEE